MVTKALSESASFVLDACLELAAEDGTDRSGDLAVIGMGKLGAGELNYSSDVDVLFVTSPSPNDDLARRLVAAARHSFRVDADLRPEGRAGPLTRTLDGYLSYWGRWADTWEFQALIKARAVAGDPVLGSRFSDAAQSQVWERTYSADELALIRRLKERSEAIIAKRGLSERELKRGPGGNPRRRVFGSAPSARPRAQRSFDPQPLHARGSRRARLVRLRRYGAGCGSE